MNSCKAICSLRVSHCRSDQSLLSIDFMAMAARGWAEGTSFLKKLVAQSSTSVAAKALLSVTPLLKIFSHMFLETGCAESISGGETGLLHGVGKGILGTYECFMLQNRSLVYKPTI